MSGVGAFLLKLREVHLLHGAHADRAEIDQLHRLIELETVDALVRQTKTCGEIVESTTCKPVGINLHGKFVALPEVADIRLVIYPLPRLVNALLAQPRSRVATQLRQDV